MLQAAISLKGLVSVVAACAALAVSRSTLYRARTPRQVHPRLPRPRPIRRIPDEQREQIVARLNSPSLADVAPAQAWARMLDETSEYLCSVRTMYRVLAERGLVRERRDVVHHPIYPRPELVARAPNQIWSWDITKLRGPVKGILYYLYVVLDIFSRYVVGWMVAGNESGALARELFEESFARQGLTAGQVRVHADRGAPMRSMTLAEKLSDLGMERSFSRPRVSNDNPFSESQFKTIKYHPSFPDRFVGGLEHARHHFRVFFPWYTDEHRHSALALLTPADVHFGRAEVILAARQRVLDAAYAQHPERFPLGPPRVARPPSEVWINPPEEKTISHNAIESH